LDELPGEEGSGGRDLTAYTMVEATGKTGRKRTENGRRTDP
jgi:hypothetical protein